MLFKKKEKTNNFIRDDELSSDSLGTKKSLFSNLFKKKEESTPIDNSPASVSSSMNINDDNMITSNINNTNTNNDTNNSSNSSLNDMYNSGGSMLGGGLVDINTNSNNNTGINDSSNMIEDTNTNKTITPINNIPTTKVKIKDRINRSKVPGEISVFDRLFDIVLVAVLVFVFLRYSPKVVNLWSNGRKDYADKAIYMATEIKNYYEQEGQKCTTDTPKKYYFNIYDSTERFGSDYKSPFLKKRIRGYVEIDDNGKTRDYYVYFTDGLFGINGVKLEDINKSSVGFSTYLTLEHPKAMECKIKFEMRD